MKRFLLPLVCAVALPVSAGVVTFKSESSSYKPLSADEQIVNVPVTWTGRTLYCDALNVYFGGGSKDSTRGSFNISNKGSKGKEVTTSDQVYLQINPATGVKVTKVTVNTCGSGTQTQSLDDMVKSDDEVVSSGFYCLFTWTGECEGTPEAYGQKRFYLHIDPSKIVDGVYVSDYKAESLRIKNVTIEYEGTPERCAMPTSSVDDCYFTSEPITLSCSEPNAKIMYALGGSDVSFKNGVTNTPADDEGYIEYDGTPIVISQPCDFSAYAYVDGKKKSGLLYRWVIPGPEGSAHAIFNFNDPESLGREDAFKEEISNEELKNNGIIFNNYSAASKASNAARLMSTITYGQDYELRHAANNNKNYNKMIFSTEDPDNTISAIYLVGFATANHFAAATTLSKSADDTYEFPDIVDYENEESANYKNNIFKNIISGSAGKYVVGWVPSEDYEGDPSNLIAFDHFNADDASNIYKVHVFYDKGESRVNEIYNESEDGVVEYYNLQGVRVSGNEPGLYIRRQGSKVNKIIVR